MCRPSIICITIFIFCQSINSQNIFRNACRSNLIKLDSLLTNESINIRDDRGRSLLHWAIGCKTPKVLDYLLEKNIKIDIEDNQGRVPLIVAINFNDQGSFDKLLKLYKRKELISKYGSDLLGKSILKRNAYFINELVSSGVDLNKRNNRGSLPIEIADRIEANDIYNLLISLGASEKKIRKPKFKGLYMGQSKPGKKPKLFAPHFISTEEQEFGSVFNADGTEFYYAVDMGGRNEIRFSKMEENHWSKPKTILSHQNYSYNDPFLSNDENCLYFISQMPLSGEGKVKDVDIWHVERTDKGWSKPINAKKNINTKRDEYYISFTKDGTMYFASNGHTREDTNRKDHDIYYSKFINNEFQKPVLLDAAINTNGYEADVFVAPDESYLIFCAIRDSGYGQGDLYISFKQANGEWSKATNMGSSINSNGYEYCPFVTKDGKYLFYTSNQDIYWVSTKIIMDIKKQKM